jgi:hypothetical protein
VVDESNERSIPHTQSAICGKAKSLFDDIKEKNVAIILPQEAKAGSLISSGKPTFTI